MNKETRLIIAAASIALALLIIVLLLTSGAELSGFQIRRGFSIN